ncbi:MAG: YMGG-like glycine zipper-containing protein [Pseudomonadota bacterium]
MQQTLPPTRVYFYPTAGQSTAQQDRDRFECHLWAVKQSGFDPSMPMPVPSPRVEVIASPPPGHDLAVGAVTGALIGAAVSHPHDAGAGAAVGAVAGAVIGAASDASRQEQAEAIARRYDQRDTQRIANMERRAEDYRRAMSACLEGRGYAVQ